MRDALESQKRQISGRRPVPPTPASDAHTHTLDSMRHVVGDEAMVCGGAAAAGDDPASGAGDCTAMAMQVDEAMMGGGASGGGDEPAGSSGDGAAVAMQIDEATVAMRTTDAATEHGAQGDGLQRGMVSIGMIDAMLKQARQRAEAAAASERNGDSRDIGECTSAGDGGTTSGDGAGGPTRRARPRAARAGSSRRRAAAAARARDGESGGGR